MEENVYYMLQNIRLSSSHSTNWKESTRVQLAWHMVLGTTLTVTMKIEIPYNWVALAKYQFTPGPELKKKYLYPKSGITNLSVSLWNAFQPTSAAT
jgi:hypothetical protein